MDDDLRIAFLRQLACAPFHFRAISRQNAHPAEPFAFPFPFAICTLRDVVSFGSHWT